jgi:hypothetical protein
VDLFRVFHWDRRSLGRSGAGPLFLPRQHQGAGRHDAPDLYGAWYCTTHPVSAIAERIQQLRGQTLTNQDFLRLGNLTLAIVGLRVAPPSAFVDLDDAVQLQRRDLRPSRVATRQRSVTQQTARRIYAEGVTGFSWWSTLSADWTNVTLFYERAIRLASIIAPPRALTVELPEVQQAADELGVRIGE